MLDSILSNAQCIFQHASEHVLRKIHHGLKFLNDLFTQNFLFIQRNFRMTFFVTAQTAFHHCTFRFITAHFVHHCTLKQALTCITTFISYPYRSKWEGRTLTPTYFSHTKVGGSSSTKG